MSTLFGNALLVIALLILFFALGTLLKAPMRGSEGAVFQPTALVLTYLALFVCLALSAVCIGQNGGLDWIPATGVARVGLVAGGLFVVVLTAALAALFKFEPQNVPTLFRFFSGFAPTLFPAVLIATGFVLLHAHTRTAVPAALWQYPLLVAVLLGLLGTAAAVLAWMSESRKHAAQHVEAVNARAERVHQDDLNYLDTCDWDRDFVRMLPYSDANQAADVRQKALAKIKSRPDWQEKLAYWLENKGALEVFQFLAANKVDDPTRLAVPVRTGVESVADWVRRKLRDATTYTQFYPEQFTYEVRHVLATVDIFEGQGVDYRPSVRAIQAAFSEPSAAELPTFDCLRTLDEWLKKR
jgi:hypothetical protein